MLRNAEPGTLRDIGLLYLACTHGVDEELHENERDLIVSKIHGRIVVATERTVFEAVREAVALYQKRREPALLEGEVQRAATDLATQMTPDDLQLIVDDLVELARADGQVSFPEREFITLVAEAFGRPLPSM
jgi:hypothetical protein